MSKKHFIALADAIRAHNVEHEGGRAFKPFDPVQLGALATFCQSQNPQFKRDRWLAYIAGECGSNGGTVKAAQETRR